MFFKFHEEMRKIFNDDIDTYNILSWITFNANYQEEYNGLKKYECAISTRSIADSTKINYSKVHRILKKLTDDGFISYTKKSNSKRENSVIYANFIAKNDAENNAKNDAKSKTVRNTVNETVGKTVEHVENTISQGCLETVDETVGKTVGATLSRNISKNISKYRANDTSKCCAFDEVWKIYPNKKGKQIAYKKFERLRKEYTLEELKRCVIRYSKDVEGKEKQYIKHGSSFFNYGYVDYLDENYEEKITKKKSPFKGVQV